MVDDLSIISFLFEKIRLQVACSCHSESEEHAITGPSSANAIVSAVSAPNNNNPKKNITIELAHWAAPNQNNKQQ